MNSQTVEQLKAAIPPSDSPWHFLTQLPFTMEAYTLYMLLLGGLVGAGVHYLTRWAKGDIKGGLFAYMFLDNPRRSVLSLISLTSELIVEMGSGLFTTSDGGFVGWGLVLLSGLKTGFLIDAIVNKADRPEWTPEQRASAAGPTAETTNAVLPITTGESNAKS